MSLPSLSAIDYSAAMPEEPSIAWCSADERASALRLLHAGLAEDGQTALVHALEAVGHQDESAFVGLLGARQAGKLSAALWVQLMPGRTALVWPPAAGDPASPALMRSAVAFLDAHDVALAQMLVSPDTPVDEHLFASAGFQELATLLYLTVDSNYFPESQPEGNLQFQPRAHAEPERLGQVLGETYEDSLDCPALNGVRSAADTIEGYRAQGVSGPGDSDTGRWYFARHDNQDVGTLILRSHADGGNWELVYMGIVPTARGHGYGWQILQYALWQSQLGKADRLVLAVDESNAHALRMYRRAGFVVWDRRTVYVRFSVALSNL